MQQPLPTEPSVCVHFCAFVNLPSCKSQTEIYRKVLALFFVAFPNAASDGAVLILLMSSGPKSDGSHMQSGVGVSMSALGRSSGNDIIVLMGAGWEARLVKVPTFVLCVCGSNGQVRTGHVMVLSLSVDQQPTVREIARDKLATYVE